MSEVEHIQLANGERAAPCGFDPLNYLAQRSTDPDFLMVEFGHDAIPVAPYQPNLTGNRAYIGIEAWLRDPHQIAALNISKKVKLSEARKEYSGNIFFMNHELGGHVEREYEEEGSESWYVGDYDPGTLLPDGIVDEVFLSNVFSDHLIAGNPENAMKLFDELVRLVKPTGKIIIRETISPSHAYYLQMFNEQMLTLRGSKLLFKTIKRETDQETWDKLEEVFNGDKGWGSPNGPDSVYAVYGRA